MKTKKALLLLLPLLLCGCGGSNPASNAEVTASGIDKRNFSTEINDKKVTLHALTNKNGLEVAITNYGGRIVSIMAPDRNGVMEDIVLGYDSMEGYLNVDDNFGAAIGRYGNRIAQGRFSLDGVEYQLAQNNFGHSLHGGPYGYHHKVWDVVNQNDSIFEISYLSPDGDEGFPGNLQVNVTYLLRADNALQINYTATTDQPTVVNLTNHAYFNLTGNLASDVKSHDLTIYADSYTPIDSTYMTTGEILSVEGTPFDFRTAMPMGKHIDDFANTQLRYGNGYDHNWVVGESKGTVRLISKVFEPTSGRTLEIYTDEPGVQFYSGNFLDGTFLGKKGIHYPQYSGFCLETQHYPDSPNKPTWPSCRLNPGETYTSECIYKFGVE